MCNWDFSTTRSLSLEVATYQYLSRLAGAPPAALALHGKWMGALTRASVDGP